LEFLTFEAADYDSALKEVRAKYGTALRVQTRKDFQVKNGVRKEKRCRITFYLVDTQKIEEPVIIAEEKSFDPASHLNYLLLENAVPLQRMEQAQKTLLQSEGEIDKSELEIEFMQYLLEGVQFEDSVHAKYVVFVGPAGVGKTTSLVKLAINLRAKESKKVALLSLDANRPGAMEQIKSFAKEYALPLFLASDEQSLSSVLPDLEGYDHILVDTSGRSSKDVELEESVSDIFKVLEGGSCEYILVISASSKFGDLFNHLKLFNEYKIEKLLATKLDETEELGSLLLFAKETMLPLAFLADGQAIPDDFHTAGASFLIPRLKGFSLDLTQLFPSV